MSRLLWRLRGAGDLADRGGLASRKWKFSRKFSDLSPILARNSKKSGFHGAGMTSNGCLQGSEPTTLGYQSADGFKFQLFIEDFPRDHEVLMEPLHALSSFFYLCAILVGPLAWGLIVFFKHRWGRSYDGAVEPSSEEILGELDSAFTPIRNTTIRTQTEYLPFLFECIRENIDSGFEDPQVISLLERIELHRPNEERRAMFSVVSGQQRSDLHMRWVRDSCDRILLRVQGSPSVIRALRAHKRLIPKALT
jgi:hypothetical protein